MQRIVSLQAPGTTGHLPDRFTNAADLLFSIMLVLDNRKKVNRKRLGKSALRIAHGKRSQIGRKKRPNFGAPINGRNREMIDKKNESKKRFRNKMKTNWIYGAV